MVPSRLPERTQRRVSLSALGLCQRTRPWDSPFSPYNASRGPSRGRVAAGSLPSRPSLVRQSPASRVCTLENSFVETCGETLVCLRLASAACCVYITADVLNAIADNCPNLHGT